MPNINESAKDFDLKLATRIGGAVRARRKALDLTAQQVADRTADLGYPMTRVAISKIEGNKRAGKVDVSELLVLAAALEISPMLLLFPTYPDGDVQLLPKVEIPAMHAADWFVGRARRGFRGEGAEARFVAEPRGPAQDLVEAVEHQFQLQRELLSAVSMKRERELNGDTVGVQIYRDLIDSIQGALGQVAARKAAAIEQLWRWGTLFSEGDDDDA